VIGVVSDLFDKDRRPIFDKANRTLKDKLRAQHTTSKRALLPLDEARDKRWALGFNDLPSPPFTGTKVIEPALSELREYIDWDVLLFHAWEAEGQVPTRDSREPIPWCSSARAVRSRQGAARRDRGQTVLRAKGVYGFWGARRGRRRHRARQRRAPADAAAAGRPRDEKPYLSLADFVADGGDHIGAFAVTTAGLGADELSERFAAEQR